jgi:hypothetical protein
MTDITGSPVTHFSEGSFMPLLVNRFIFSMIPAQAPFFLRPLLKPIFSAVDAKVVAGPLNASLKYVCRLETDMAYCDLMLVVHRSRRPLRNRTQAGSLVAQTRPWPII